MSDSHQMDGVQPDGNAVHTPGDDSLANNPPAKDSVQYATYQRVLSEKKRAADELARVRGELDEIRQAQEAEQARSLEEQKKYQQLWENEKQRSAEALQKAQELEARQTDAKKLNAVLTGLPSQIPNKFWGLVNTDSVIIHPETGEVDTESVQREVDRIVKDMPEILAKPSNATIDPAAPKPNGSGKLSADEISRLPQHERAAALANAGAPEWMVNGGGQFSRQR